MRVAILGPVTASDGNGPVDLGGPRNRALVARLALDAGRGVGVTTLIDDLWGPDVPADAQNALQSVVSRTRRRLPPGVLVSTPTGYRLDVDPDDVDAHRFDQLRRAGETHAALALWRGAPLGGVGDAPFAAAAAARLEELRLGAVEERIGAELQQGAIDPGSLVTELESLVEAHPYREGLWAHYLRALVGAERQAEALLAYERMRAELADTLGVDPSPRLQDLHVAILRGDPALRPPAPAARHNLRASVTSFVGREQAVKQLHEMLAEHRLITLVGPGGAGKTRLAIETARSLEAGQPGRAGQAGTWLVELASVTGDDGILGAFLLALGLREIAVLDRGTGRQPVDAYERLLETLRGREFVLIVDNCEHLIAAVAGQVEDLLAQVPGLRVIATSREPLAVTGEAVFVVPSLGLPAEGCEPAEALEHSAVQLFVERARAADPDFILDRRTLPATVEICRRLDGQPLAIELAAARLRALTCDQVAARLGDRFRLLTGGSRTALPRHRTLRAVVEWSWDLLAPHERVAAERVAVFPAGVTAEGAQAVLGGEDTLETLMSLADKSLLVPVRVDAGLSPRFRMLETLREYGTERLVEQGVADDVRSAHVAYFLGLAESLEPLLRGPRQLEALAVLDVERDNLTAALRHAVDRSDVDRAARLVAALGWYWTLRSQHVEAAAWGATVLGLKGSPTPFAELACAALAVSGTLGEMGQDAERQALVERIVGLGERVGDEHPLAALVLTAVAMFSALGSDEPFEPREHSDPWARAAVQVMRHGWLENSGRAPEAAPMLPEALAGFREVGDRWGMAMCLAQIGSQHQLDGDLAAAQAAISEAVDLLEQLGADEDARNLRTRSAGLGLVGAGPAELPGLREEFERLRAEAESHGTAEAELIATMLLAELEHLAGRPERALEVLSVGAAVVRRPQGWAGAPQVTALVLAATGIAELETGDVTAGARSLDEASHVALRTTDMPVVAAVTVSFARLALACGEPVLAARRLGAADRIRGQADASSRLARTTAEAVRSALGETAYADAYDAGRGLDRDEAIEMGCPATGDDQALRR